MKDSKQKINEANKQADLVYALANSKIKKIKFNFNNSSKRDMIA